jgi:predicted nucleic acid-binding protein
MIVVDTSVIIDSLSGPKRSASALRSAVERGERLLMPSLVLYEWLRGPRLEEELIAQEALFPSNSAVPFGAPEALVSARLYRSVRRPRGRELDLAIAACAVVREAALWTLNAADFRDIPGLRLWPSDAAIES